MKLFAVPYNLAQQNPTVSANYFSYFLKFNLFLIPILPSQLTYVKRNIDLFDGLLLPGGGDINPLYSNKYDSSICYSETQDHLDFTLLKIFYEHKKKIIGICRGIQEINTFFHGTLFMNIEGHMNSKHYVYFLTNKYLVNSFHHQMIDKLGNNLTITYVDKNKKIEGIKKDSLIIGYQFHIERLKSKHFKQEIMNFLEIQDK